MPITPEQRTRRAREAFDAKFSTPEEKSEYFRSIGRQESERRRGGVVLSADEAATLVSVYRQLREIAQRLPDPDSQAKTDGTDRAA